MLPHRRARLRSRERLAPRGALRPQSRRGGRAGSAERYGHRKRKRRDGGVLPRPFRLRDVSHVHLGRSDRRGAVRGFQKRHRDRRRRVLRSGVRRQHRVSSHHARAGGDEPHGGCLRGQALTCMGLAGAGDMVATCMSRHSRNRRFGQDFVALGKTLDDFEREFHMVVEGPSPARRSLFSPTGRGSSCRSPTRCAPSCGRAPMRAKPRRRSRTVR